MGTHFKEVEIPNQKHFDSHPLPCVLTPNTTSSPTNTLSDLLASIRAEKPYLESVLHKSGAILFRGFPVVTPSDFNDVVEAFGYEEFPYVGGIALRTQVFGRVFTANESPLHLKLGFHHEMSQYPEFPSKLLFFCEVEPVGGGETPISPSNVAYERVKRRHPDFLQRLEEHGLIYSVAIGEEDDPSSPIGRGWKSQFYTHDKKIAEERAAKIGLKLDWSEDGRVKSSRGPTPAVRYDESRNRKIWFNGMGVTYSILEDDPQNYRGLMLTFGDGKPLPQEIVSDCMGILEDESVAFPWQKGDILLIDNLAVLHGRRPCNPPRRVLASLCK